MKPLKKTTPAVLPSRRLYAIEVPSCRDNILWVDVKLLIVNFNSPVDSNIGYNEIG